ncbi:MAG: sigma 54-interacting transcriptional regulator [Spirochaetes bacterium]|nr:sigma 54-interacting transcriptional regulator [Spirochaetota bacterium]MBU0955357.1 sigma 54-interacting transcriptional regulator [Spirochaetota bacterium]
MTIPLAENTDSPVLSGSTVSKNALPDSAQRLRQERDQLDLLLELARLLDQYPRLEDAAEPFVDLLAQRLGFSQCWLALPDPEAGGLRICAWSSEPEPTSETSIRLGSGRAGRVFESGQTLIVSGDAAGMEAGPLIYVPLLGGQQVCGILMTALPAGAYGDSGVELAAYLERTVALVVDSLELRRRLELAAVAAGSRPDGRAGQFVAVDSSGSAGRGGHEQPYESAYQPESAALSAEISGHSPGTVDSIGRSPFGNLIGTSTVMQEIYLLVQQVAATEATVLISGESGTGKELCAADIHAGSMRRDGPLVKVNCAALPESIIESELFGHEKGAFTGAAALRRGRFELADGGTLFLDEIGELSPQVQVKLLRVLQEREIERVGGAIAIPVDVRIIAATNRNLEKEMQEGRFREDLYYRLNVFPLHMPPLRQRPGDILLLTDWFIEKYARRNNKKVLRISSPAIDLLAMYHWPGNVRELENCIERAVILSTDMVIHSWHLPPSLQSAASTHTEPGSTLEAALARLEKELIVEALKLHKGNMAAAARCLGISERQMGLRVHHYGLNWRRYRQLL